MQYICLMEGKRTQLCATVDDEIFVEVHAMALKERRSVSEMTAILIRNAVKERNRKKKKDGPQTTTQER